jgi:hypothetical protein
VRGQLRGDTGVFPVPSNTLTVTSDKHFYGAYGPQSDNYNSAITDSSGSPVEVCAPAGNYPSQYGQNCYDNESYPATYPNV